MKKNNNNKTDAQNNKTKSLKKPLTTPAKIGIGVTVGILAALGIFLALWFTIGPKAGSNNTPTPTGIPPDNKYSQEFTSTSLGKVIATTNKFQGCSPSPEPLSQVGITPMFPPQDACDYANDNDLTLIPAEVAGNGIYLKGDTTKEQLDQIRQLWLNNPSGETIGFDWVFLYAISSFVEFQGSFTQVTLLTGYWTDVNLIASIDFKNTSSFPDTDILEVTGFKSSLEMSNYFDDEKLCYSNTKCYLGGNPPGTYCGIGKYFSPDSLCAPTDILMHIGAFEQLDQPTIDYAGDLLYQPALGSTTLTFTNEATDNQVGDVMQFFASSLNLPFYGFRKLVGEKKYNLYEFPDNVTIDFDNTTPVLAEGNGYELFFPMDYVDTTNFDKNNLCK